MYTPSPRIYGSQASSLHTPTPILLNTPTFIFPDENSETEVSSTTKYFELCFHIFLFLCAGINTGSPSTFYPEFAREAGVSPSLIAMFFSSYCFIGGIACFFVAPMTNCMGSRWTHCMGVAFNTLPNIGLGLLYFLRDDPIYISLCIVLRGLTGFGASFVYITGYAFAAKQTEGTTLYVVALETAYGVGVSFGPIYGAYAFKMLGYFWTFAFMGALGFLSIPISLLFSRSDEKVEKKENKNVASISDALQIWEVWLVVSGLIIVSAAFSYLQPVWETYVLHKLNGGFNQVQIVFTFISLSYLFASWTVIASFNYISVARCMQIGAFTLALGFSFVASSSISVNALCALAIGGGVSYLSCPSIQLFEMIIPDDIDSSVASGSIFNLCWSIGGTFGPLISTALVSSLSLPIACEILAIITAIFFIIWTICLPRLDDRSNYHEIREQRSSNWTIGMPNWFHRWMSLINIEDPLTSWTHVILFIAAGINSQFPAPFFPEYAELNGISPTLVAYFFSSYYLVGGIMCLFVTTLNDFLGDSYSHKLGVLTNLIPNLILGGISGYVKSSWFIYVCIFARGLTGFGATIVYVTGYGFAASHDNTTFYVVLLQTAYGIGISLGPTYGALIFQTVGYSSSFYILGILGVLTFPLTFYMKHSKASENSADASKPKASIFEILQNWRILVVSTLVCLIGISMVFLSPVWEPYVLHQLHGTVWEAQIVFTCISCSYFIGSWASIPLLEKFSEEVVLMGCGALFLSLGFWSIYMSYLWIQGVSACFIGFGIAISSCPVIQLCEKLLSREKDSSIANGALYNLSWSVGGVAGPVLAETLSYNQGVPSSCRVMALILFFETVAWFLITKIWKTKTSIGGTKRHTQ